MGCFEFCVRRAEKEIHSFRRVPTPNILRAYIPLCPFHLLPIYSPYEIHVTSIYIYICIYIRYAYLLHVDITSI